jgi:hypothetical protein
MNRLARALLATGLATALLAGPALAAPKTIDLKGQTNWISEAPVEKIVGTADGSGTLTGDLDDLSTLRGTIKFPVASMKSGNFVSASEIAQQRWGKSHPNLVRWIKAGVAGGGD